MEITRSAVYCSTIWLESAAASVAPWVSSGRLISSPRWDSGSAARKMTISTSSTSMNGVMLMSAVECGCSAATTESAP